MLNVYAHDDLVADMEGDVQVEDPLVAATYDVAEVEQVYNYVLRVHIHILNADMGIILYNIFQLHSMDLVEAVAVLKL
jgi:hypothetical protein